MAEIVAFRAYRYSPEQVELFKAVTQPYDKISPDMQEKYYAASPFNLIAVEKGKTRRMIPPRTMSIHAPRRVLRTGSRRACSSAMRSPRVRLLSGVHRAGGRPQAASGGRARDSSRSAGSRIIPPE